MKRIIWLASYPKSGNTWMRVFLTNLRRDASEPADINQLDPILMASNRVLFDTTVGYDSGDLTHEEVDFLRPSVYRYHAARETKRLFCKVHDAYTLLPGGQPMFPPDVTEGVVYMVRNPLDVCVSFAHHVAEPIEEVVSAMTDPRFAMLNERHCLEAEQLRQRLLTWSGHVRSWIDAPDLRIHVIRYEDMKSQPVEAFTRVAAFLDMPQERAKIERALAFSSLEVLQRQEREHGFNGTLARDRTFFRKGKVGSWREVLTPAQADRIIQANRDVMVRFGYLTEAGEPVC